MEARAQIDLEDLRLRARDLQERAAAFIRERPLTALLVAVGAGYLAGRILRS